MSTCFLTRCTGLLKRASNAGPKLRMDSDIASMKTLGLAGESSFSASKNKCSPSPAFPTLTAYRIFLQIPLIFRPDTFPRSF